MGIRLESKEMVDIKSELPNLLKEYTYHSRTPYRWRVVERIGYDVSFFLLI